MSTEHLNMAISATLRKSLEEAYAELEEESKRLEQEFAKADAESLKYVD